MVKPIFILEAFVVIGTIASIGVIIGLRKNQILSKKDKIKTFFTFLLIYVASAFAIFLFSKLVLM